MSFLPLNTVVALPAAVGVSNPPTFIYVRSTGNDVTGDGLTPGTAYLTPERALKDIPILLNGNLYAIDMSGYGVYNLPVGGFYLPQFVGNNNYFYDPVQDPIVGFAKYYYNVSIVAEPIVDDTINVGTMTQVQDPITGLVTLTDTSKSWTVDQWKGFQIVDDYFVYGVIVSNTATQLFISSSFQFLSFGGTVISIIHPSCEFLSTAYDSVFSVVGGSAGVSLRGIKLNSPNSVGVVAQGNSGTVDLIFCDIAGIASNTAGPVAINACYVHKAAAGSAYLYAYYNIQPTFVSYSFVTNMYVIFAFSGYSSVFNACDALGEAFTNAPPIESDLYLSSCEVRNSISRGVHIRTDRPGNWIQNVRINNSPQWGILLSVNATALIQNVVGTGNGYYGIFLEVNCSVYATGTNTITGTLGDIKIGSLPVRSWASFTTEPPLYLESDDNGDGSRLLGPGYTFLDKMPLRASWTQPAVGLRKVIYVRTTGSDAGGVGTLALPYLTFQRAIKDVPEETGGIRYIIDVTGLGVINLGTGFVMPTVRGNRQYVYNYVDAVFPSAEGETDLNISAVPTVIDTQAVISSQVPDPQTTLITLTVPGTPWTVNQHRGRLVMGANSFEIAAIASNTANTLEIAADLTITAPFTIVEPSAEFAITSGTDSFVLNYSDAGVFFNGIRFSHVSTSSFVYAVSVNSPNSSFVGCILDSGTFANTGQFYGATINQSGVVGKSLFFERAGILQYAFVYKTKYGGGRIGGTFDTFSYGIIADTCSPFGQGDAFGSDSLDGGFTISVSEFRNGTSHGIVSLFKGSSCTINNVRTRDCTGDGLRVAGGMLSITGLHGTGNTGYGLQDARGEVIETGTGCDVTGSLGDIKVGLKPVRTWVHFHGTAPVGIESDIVGTQAILRGSTSTATGLWVPTTVQIALYTARLWESVQVNPTAGGFIVNLPTAVGFAGQQVKIKNVTSSTNTVTVTPFGAETIDGSPTVGVSVAYQALWLESDGANWNVV